MQLDDNGQPAPLLPPDEAAPPRIPLRPGLLTKLTEKGEKILDQVEQITARVNTLLDDKNQKGLTSAVDNVAQAAANVSQLSANLDTVLTAQFGPRNVDIPSLVKRTDAVMTSLRSTSDEARATIQEIGVTARRLNEKDGPIDRLATAPRRSRMRPIRSMPPPCRASTASPRTPRAPCAS